MFSGQDAEVSFELSSVTSLSHSILVGEIHQIDEKGIVTKEGFSANLSAGNSPLIDNISSDPRFFNTTTDQEPLDKMFFKFSVSTKREIWGAHAKMVHLTGIYIRDFNLEERFIPFGANFAFHIK